MNKLDRRNMIFFGLGTIGRDMFYAFEAMPSFTTFPMFSACR